MSKLKQSKFVRNSDRVKNTLLVIIALLSAFHFLGLDNFVNPTNQNRMYGFLMFAALISFIFIQTGEKTKKQNIFLFEQAFTGYLMENIGTIVCKPSSIVGIVEDFKKNCGEFTIDYEGHELGNPIRDEYSNAVDLKFQSATNYDLKMMLFQLLALEDKNDIEDGISRYLYDEFAQMFVSKLKEDSKREKWFELYVSTGMDEKMYNDLATFIPAEYLHIKRKEHEKKYSNLAS